ncbi:MAG: ATP synthase F1 subunit delta [bacterium]|nr:ATP synthase F1 subunit delta [bacterium]
MDDATRTQVLEGYAAGLLAIARAEGGEDTLAGELFSIGRAIDGSDELRDAITDIRVPVERKQALLVDVLDGRASSIAIALVNMLVGAGKARYITEIGRLMIDKAAQSQELTVAEVRSAIDLDAATIARLEQNLTAATGKRIKANVIVDPTVVGGLVAKVGDTIFDGSVRSRLQDLREAWA